MAGRHYKTFPINVSTFDNLKTFNDVKRHLEDAGQLHADGKLAHAMVALQVAARTITCLANDLSKNTRKIPA
ncbi:MAG: hypothetical protein AB7F96_16490 [Beijerinckiaceae bacterium]